MATVGIGLSVRLGAQACEALLQRINRTWRNECPCVCRVRIRVGFRVRISVRVRMRVSIRIRVCVRIRVRQVYE